MPRRRAPAYQTLPSGELVRRAGQALESLGRCRLCPRDCEVNRIEDRWAACKTGRYAVVSSAFAHFGEEDCLRGWNGSGTIFFSHCNLRCVFCQNADISQAIRPAPGAGERPEAIAELMLGLEARGCHNLNLVTPEHVVPQVLEALVIAVDRGFHLPLVYNTSAYDSMESLALLDGVVDLYMPDFKYWSPERAGAYLKAADYPDVARRAIREMHRQVGSLVLDDDGLAQRGLLLRHLVMPGAPEETSAILTWVARELGPDTYVNLMDQYHPAGLVTGDRHPELARAVTVAEFEAAGEAARRAGIWRLDGRRLDPRHRQR